MLLLAECLLVVIVVFAYGFGFCLRCAGFVRVVVGISCCSAYVVCLFARVWCGCL